MDFKHLLSDRFSLVGEENSGYDSDYFSADGFLDRAVICLQLMSAHQQELDEIMEKMDTERQRQQANLHQKLMERKKRKQDAQKRKQEREMAKELLEQKKELAEVRTEHVSSKFIARDVLQRARDSIKIPFEKEAVCQTVGG